MQGVEKLFSTVDEKIKELTRRIKRLEDTPRRTFGYRYVLFGDTDALPTSESAFSYNETTNTLTVDNIATQTWQAPTLLNSWVNYSGGLSPAGYYKDPMSVVRLKGLISSGTTTAGTILFTLPAGYRPAQSSAFATAAFTSAWVFGSVVVQTNGNVEFTAGGNGIFSLDNVSFRAA